MRVELRADDEATHVLVSDTGRGIPPEHLPHIFERFHRVDAVRNDRHLGIGLSIVRAIVEAHGGSITAASEVGRGTTMHVRLSTAPFPTGNDPASYPQSAQFAIPPCAGEMTCPDSHDSGSGGLGGDGAVQQKCAPIASTWTA